MLASAAICSIRRGKLEGSRYARVALIAVLASIVDTELFTYDSHLLRVLRLFSTPPGLELLEDRRTHYWHATQRKHP